MGWNIRNLNYISASCYLFWETIYMPVLPSIYIYIYMFAIRSFKFSSGDYIESTDFRFAIRLMIGDDVL